MRCRAPSIVLYTSCLMWVIIGNRSSFTGERMTRKFWTLNSTCKIQPKFEFIYKDCVRILKLLLIPMVAVLFLYARSLVLVYYVSIIFFRFCCTHIATLCFIPLAHCWSSLVIGALISSHSCWAIRHCKASAFLRPLGNQLAHNSAGTVVSERS